MAFSNMTVLLPSSLHQLLHSDYCFWSCWGFGLYKKKQNRLLLVLLTQSALPLTQTEKLLNIVEQSVVVALTPPSVYVNATSAADET